VGKRVPTIQELSYKHRISITKIRNAIYDGKLAATRWDTTWTVEEVDFLKWLKAIGQEDNLYTIPLAAQMVGVNKRTLRYAVERGAVPFTPIEGVDGVLKAVKLEDVVEWNNNRKPSNAGRKPTPK
jgi:hypothetical protein